MDRMVFPFCSIFGKKFPFHTGTEVTLILLGIKQGSSQMITKALYPYPMGCGETGMAGEMEGAFDLLNMRQPKSTKI